MKWRDVRLRIVAPIVGAWIEIIKFICCYNCRTVAPIVGAWIEIKVDRYDYNECLSRSYRGSVD